MGSLASYLPYLRIFLFVLIFVVLVVLLVLFLSAKRRKPKAAAKPAAPPPPEEAAGPSLTEEPAAEEKRTSFPELAVAQSFAGAVKTLGSNVSGRDFRYQIPWFLMLGPSKAGKTSALGKSGLNLPFGSPVRMEHEVKEVCHWWFFEKGLVLDVAGDLILREDGRSSDADAWRTLLRQLHKYRNERPVDGIVLTIPLTDLLDPEGGIQDLNQAAERADRMYEKLREAQTLLGMRLTVYVLVTKCDQLDGFQSLGREIPGRMQGDMFGWSSPYTVETGYNGEWVNEAVQAVNGELIETQFEMFTEGADAVDAEGLYLFSSRFRQFAGPLKVYLDRLFKDSVYHEPFMFRGLFFCGDSGDEKESREGPGRLLFVKDLFEKKVFPEFGLSRPVARYVRSRNRAVMFTQIAAAVIFLIGALGLWNADSNLRAGHRSLLPVFQSIQKDMGEIRAMRTAREFDRTTYGESTINLLGGMTKIRTGDLRSIFVPSSWPNRLHEDIVGSLTVAYREFILRTMFLELQHRAQELSRGPATGEVAESRKGRPRTILLGETEEYRDLRSFIAELAALEGNITLYNGFSTAGAGDLNHLGQLVKYLFDVDLPKDFYDNAVYYREALARVSTATIEPRNYQRDAVARGERLANRLNEHLFDSNPVAIYLDALAEQLDALGVGERTPSENNKLIREILTNINDLENALAKSDMASLSHWTLDLGKDFDHMVDTAGRLKVLGPEFANRIKKQGEVLFPKFKEDLLNRRTDLTGPLLFRKKGESRVAVAGDLLALRDGLEDLMLKPFMAVPPDMIAEISVPPISRFRWDIDFLSKATGIFDSYEDFRLMGIKKFPKGIQNIIINVARHNLDKNVIHLIGQASRPESSVPRDADRLRKTEVLAEIRNFQDAEPMLTHMMGLFDRLDLVSSYQTLSGLINWQVISLLNQVDSFMGEDDLYQPWGGDFNWWDGQPGLAMAAFDAVDPDDLKNYLDFQRERVRQLADEFARPLIRFLVQNPVLQNRKENRSYYKWERILVQFDKYGNKQPDNSISILEKFVAKEMDQITLENYYKRLNTPEMRRPSGDFFLLRRNELRDQIYRQCVRLATGRLQREYNVMQEFFNNRLAGRFPFSPVDERRAYPEADPRDVREFYRVFDRNAAGAIEVLKSREAGDLYGRDAGLFLDQMLQVRPLFAAYLEDPVKEPAKNPASPEEPAAGGEGEKKDEAKKTDEEGKLEYPAIDFECDFRVNRERERGGNRIIEWKLYVGDQEFKATTPKKMGRWMYGQPVSLVLRWAKDSPYYPVDAGEDAHIDVEQKTVTYDFENSWAMIRLLRTYAASPADFRGMSDPKPHTLKLPVHVRNEQAEDKSNAKTLSTVFVRVGTFTADKKKDFLTIPAFPMKAPDWN